MTFQFPVVLLLAILCTYTTESADPMADFCNKDSPTVSKGSKISANIDKVLAELVPRASSTGYFATSSGNDQDQVYGLAQCRGDVVGSKECSSCIQDAANQTRQRCPNQADARIWYDYCFLRYSNKNFIGEVDTSSYGLIFYNVNNVTDPEKFNKELGDLVDKIKAQAAVPKNGGFGKGEAKLSTFETLYAAVQCTRDLDQLECSQCLAIAVGNYATICENRKGCRVLYSSCYVRYELYPFFYPADSENALAATENTLMTVIYP